MVVTITGSTDEQLAQLAFLLDGGELRKAFVRYAKELLIEDGYSVQKAHDWEKPHELCERLKISHSHLNRMLKKPTCPEPDDISRGKKRIVYLLSNPRLDSFLTQYWDSTKRQNQKEQNHATGH